MMRPSRSDYLDLPDVRLHIRRWGKPEAPTLFLLHGWMDVSASFQFVVDELQRDWNIVAPDWRGFGPSQWLHRPYYFAEHMGDMEAILDHYAPDGQVRRSATAWAASCPACTPASAPSGSRRWSPWTVSASPRPRRTWPPNATGNG